MRAYSRPGFPSPATSRSSVEARLAPTEEAHGDLAFVAAGLARGFRLGLGRFFASALRRFLALGHFALGAFLALFALDFLGLRLLDLASAPSPWRARSRDRRGR